MSAPELVEFDHDAGIAAEYLDLVRRLHAGDPEWIDPLLHGNAQAASRQRIRSSPRPATVPVASRFAGTAA